MNDNEHLRLGWKDGLLHICVGDNPTRAVCGTLVGSAIELEGDTSELMCPRCAPPKSDPVAALDRLIHKQRTKRYRE